MSKHALLDNITHKDLRIIPGFGRGMGTDYSAARVFPVEFSQLQMEYPIVFTKNGDSGHFEPMALLGLAENENLFLTDAGWDARYIPLSIQRQPFLIGFQESVEDGIPQRNPVVTIDLEHPKVSETEGEPIFLEHGGESPMLEQINRILMTIHQGHEINQALSRLLVGLDLIESFTLSLELIDGSEQNLGGLYTINEERLRELNASALESLHKPGHLQTVYMVLASMPNLNKLIERKNLMLKAAASGD
jgi:hypothetical protein